MSDHYRPTSIVPGVINQEGLPLLQTWRSDVFGDREIHASVTDVGVISSPNANAFVLPSTYRQVPPPSALNVETGIGLHPGLGLGLAVHHPD